MLMYVLEDVAQPARQLQSLIHRQDTSFPENVIQCPALEILHDDVQAALLRDGDYLEDSRMIQLSDDCSFARKARRTHFQSGVGDFQNDGLPGLTVNGLEDCGHPASFDKSLDLEAPVDQFADF